MHWGDGLECRQEGGIEPGSGDLEVVDRRFEDRCIEPCREALLLTGRDDRVLVVAMTAAAWAGSRSTTANRSARARAPPRRGRSRTPQELRDKPARELGVAQPAAAERVSPQPVGRQREDQPQDPIVRQNQRSRGFCQRWRFPRARVRRPCGRGRGRGAGRSRLPSNNRPRSPVPRRAGRAPPPRRLRSPPAGRGTIVRSPRPCPR